MPEDLQPPLALGRSGGIVELQVDAVVGIDALDALSTKLTTKDLAAWNQATDVDKEDPVDVATAWLKDRGLI